MLQDFKGKPAVMGGGTIPKGPLKKSGSGQGPVQAVAAAGREKYGQPRFEKIKANIAAKPVVAPVAAESRPHEIHIREEHHIIHDPHEKAALVHGMLARHAGGLKR